MKTCKGCGSYYNKKCDYCGYVDNEWDEKGRVDIVTLKVNGNMNDINIKYGESQRDNIIVSGNMQDFTFKAMVVNIIIDGNMNDIKLDKKIKYTINTKGNMNEIKIKRMVMGICL